MQANQEAGRCPVEYSTETQVLNLQLCRDGIMAMDNATSKVALRMPRLPVVQLMQLASLAFVAFVALCGEPVAAQTQQDSTTPIPSLSGYDSVTRQSIELACIVKKSDGPVTYGACLNQQIASMKGSPGIPSLVGYDNVTRQSIELACIVKKSDGPVAYGTCLDRQISTLQGSSGIPSLSGYDRETRQSIELACIVKKSDGPVAYGACLNQQISSLKGSSSSSSPSGTQSDVQREELAASTASDARHDTGASRAPAVHPVDPMSRFTSENVLKIHQGMGSNKILEMFGAPKNVSQAVCGAFVGKQWACTTWEYGDVPYEWASFTFAGRNGALILNSFDVHRK